MFEYCPITDSLPQQIQKGRKELKLDFHLTVHLLGGSVQPCLSTTIKYSRCH
ncbi:rCG21484, partial [Rattus norvegicus]